MEDSKERLYVALQQMFPTSTEEEVDEMKPLTDSYHKYKREYLKHLGFNPEEENLSKCTFNSLYSFASSFCAGAHAT